MAEKNKKTENTVSKNQNVPYEETVFIGKILGVKSKKEMHKKSFIEEGGDISEGLYSDVRKIPLDRTSPSFKVEVVSGGPTFDNSSQKISKISTDYLYTFFENSENIRFYTKIDSEDELVLVIARQGKITLTINLHQMLSYSDSKPSCLDKSFLAIKEEENNPFGGSYLIGAEDLKKIIPKIKNFYTQYKCLSERMSPIDFTLIKELKEETNKTSNIFLKFFNWFGFNFRETDPHYVLDVSMRDCEDNEIGDDVFYNEINRNKKISIERLFV